MHHHYTTTTLIPFKISLLPPLAEPHSSAPASSEAHQMSFYIPRYGRLNKQQMAERVAKAKAANTTAAAAAATTAAAAQRQADNYPSLIGAENGPRNQSSSGAPGRSSQATSSASTSSPFASSAAGRSTQAIPTDDPPAYYTNASRPTANLGHPRKPNVFGSGATFTPGASVIPDPFQHNTIGAIPHNASTLATSDDDDDDDDDDVNAALLPPGPLRASTRQAAPITLNLNTGPAADHVSSPLADANPLSAQSPILQCRLRESPHCRLYVGRGAWLAKGVMVARYPLSIGERCRICRAVFEVQNPDAPRASFNRTMLTVRRCGCSFHRECLWGHRGQKCPWCGMKWWMRGIWQWFADVSSSSSNGLGTDPEVGWC